MGGQLLSWTAVTPEQLDTLAGLLDGSVWIEGLTVDAELRWALLQRLAATGRAGDAEIDAELDRDSTDEGRRLALACRAAIPDDAHKAEAWRLLAESDELGADGISQVARGFGQPEHSRLLAGIADRIASQEMTGPRQRRSPGPRPAKTPPARSRDRRSQLTCPAAAARGSRRLPWR